MIDTVYDYEKATVDELRSGLRDMLRRVPDQYQRWGYYRTKDYKSAALKAQRAMEGGERRRDTLVQLHKGLSGFWS